MESSASGSGRLLARGEVRDPQRCGRYVLVDRIGSGGMAEVFRAVMFGPEDFQRLVVVKRIHAHLSHNPSFIKMLIDEATLCGRLSHPYVIQVHEFGQHAGAYFIAMEHVDGRNLSEIMVRLSMRGEGLRPVIAAEVMRQACSGLGYAHGLTEADGSALGIIHRDVTPANIMVSFSGAVKVLDFGIARAAAEARLSQTETGSVKGKSSYLAPEQIGQQEFDHRVDIFASGIVLHELLTGKRLFKAHSPAAVMELIKQMPIAPPSKIKPQVPHELDAIVMRALDRDPDARYSSAAEMADALDNYVVEQRFSNRELIAFMRELWAGEVTQETPLPTRSELRALMGAGDASDLSGPVRVPSWEVHTAHGRPGPPNLPKGARPATQITGEQAAAKEAQASAGEKARLSASETLDADALIEETDLSSVPGLRGNKVVLAALALAALGAASLAAWAVFANRSAKHSETNRIARSAVKEDSAQIHTLPAPALAGAETGQPKAPADVQPVPDSAGGNEVDLQPHAPSHSITSTHPSRGKPVREATNRGRSIALPVNAESQRVVDTKNKVRNAIPIDPFAQ